MPLSIDELRTLHERLNQDDDVGAFYERFPPTKLWGEHNKAISSSLIRSATSVQNLVQEMQKTLLFGVNSELDLKLAAVEWLVRKYKESGIDVEQLDREIEESPYSNPQISVSYAGRKLSVDFLRMIAIGQDIRRFLQKSNPPLYVIELGAGLGHLARALRLMSVSRCHVVLDLPDSLMFSYAFISLNFPQAAIHFVRNREEAARVRPADYDFLFVPSCFAESVDFGGAELFVNTCSLGEMNNINIRYWMDFVQRKLPVKFLFTQNRFLNAIDASMHAWRWEENECSVLYDASWTILKWDLEPPWFQCPYVTSVSARSVDIVASRETPRVERDNAVDARRLLEEVQLEDWYRLIDTPAFMSVRQNRLVVDVTMTGTLFKLWESIRLHPTSEAVWVLLRYLDILSHRDFFVFEETKYYEELFQRLAMESSSSDRVASLRLRSLREPSSSITVVGSTAEHNVLAVEFRTFGSTGPATVKRFFTIANKLGAIDLYGSFREERGARPRALNLLGERIGERDLPGLVWVRDTLEEALQVAANFESKRPEISLEDSVDGFNIVRTPSGYLALAMSLGPIDLFQEYVGEKELSPVLLKASTYQEIRWKIQQVHQPRVDGSVG